VGDDNIRLMTTEVNPKETTRDMYFCVAAKFRAMLCVETVPTFQHTCNDHLQGELGSRMM
jgi:hypothetical protein